MKKYASILLRTPLFLMMVLIMFVTACNNHKITTDYGELYNAVFTHDEHLAHLIFEKKYLQASNYYNSHQNFFNDNKGIYMNILHQLAIGLNDLMLDPLLLFEKEMNFIPSWEHHTDNKLWKLYKKQIKKGHQLIAKYESHKVLFLTVSFTSIQYSKLKMRIDHLYQIITADASKQYAKYLLSLPDENNPLPSFLASYPVDISNEKIKLLSRMKLNDRHINQKIISTKNKPSNEVEMNEDKVNKVNKPEWYGWKPQWPFATDSDDYSIFFGSYAKRQSINNIKKILKLDDKQIFTKTIHLGSEKFYRLFLKPTPNYLSLLSLIKQACKNTDITAVMLNKSMQIIQVKNNLAKGVSCYDSNLLNKTKKN